MTNDLAALLREPEKDPELAEQLRVATVRAISTMAAYCADPRSEYHTRSVEYMAPRARFFAGWLAANSVANKE